MKKIFLVTLTLVTAAISFAQTRTESIEYQKVKREALMVEVPFPEKTVSDAIEDTLKKLGYKGKKNKGFVMYSAVSLPVIAQGKLDLYFSVDRKSRKEKQQSVVMLMLSREFDNFLTQNSDPTIMSNAKGYLDSLRNIVAIYDLEQQINEQQQLLSKHEKDLKGLIEDGEDYEKKRKKIEEQLSDNLKEQGKQRSEINIQMQVLETLKAKRRI